MLNMICVAATTIELGAYVWFMHEVKKHCDRIVGDQTYEEYLKNYADKLAEEQRRKWNEEESR